MFEGITAGLIFIAFVAVKYRHAKEIINNHAKLLEDKNNV
jgi:hypothetical protein